MFKIKVTEKSGASIEYIGDESVISKLPEMGHGLPERPELNGEGAPTGVMLPAEYTVEVVDISHEYALQECLAARKAAYPSPEEFMNAFFDGGEQAIEIMRQVRLTIKAAHPKPVKEA